ncbi:MAG TPA: menaquinone biosynthesis protein [Phycisphaerales bacterium]|nr:menaquinone biosynthesis protein [Phycisphaerales bacterium]
MEPIRVACVRYLNTAPLVEGLEKVQGLTLVPAVPSVIAGMVRSEEADLGLCSVVDAVGLPGSDDPALALVPAGMIGCDGPTLTVRVFSAVPFEQVTTLHADTDSHTSVILAQVILSRRYGVRPRVIGFDARERMPLEGAAPSGSIEESWPPTVLLIGDKVVTDCPPASRYPYQLDLGEQWKALTGLPFAYAVWMCRREDVGSQKVKAATALLDRHRRHNATRLDWVIARRQPASRWPAEEAERYLTQLLRFEVGEREREAVGAFIAEARALGLVADREPAWAF